MNAVEHHLWMVKLGVGVILFFYACWLAWHSIRHDNHRRKSNDHEMRLVKMENYPSHEDRLKSIEENQDLLIKQMDALKGNVVTAGTLKRVH